MFLCLCGIYRPTRESFTHMRMSPLPVKGCKFRPMLGTHGHWAVRVLKRATPTMTQEHPSIMVISEDPWDIPIAERLSVELFLRLRSVAAGNRKLNLPIAGQRCNPPQIIMKNMSSYNSKANIKCFWESITYILKCFVEGKAFEKISNLYYWWELRVWKILYLRFSVLVVIIKKLLSNIVWKL